MKNSHWLWLLWAAMFLSVLVKGSVDAKKFTETSVLVALIVLPILTVLLEMQEEVKLLKEEGKYQRKFVMERYNILNEKMNDLSSNIEKKIVVDFSEFAKENPPPQDQHRRGLGKKLKKKRPIPEGTEKEKAPQETPDQDFAKISKTEEPPKT